MSILSEKISSTMLVIVMLFATVIGFILNTTSTAYAAADVFVGTDGKVMSSAHAKQWEYEVNWDGVSVNLTRYKGSFTTDGQIIGVVPESINGLPVTHMEYTFYQAKNLVKAPVIPKTVQRMYYTFLECQNLREAPVLHYGLKDLSETFVLCINLKTAPEIPASVTILRGTFSNCINMVKAPSVIPASVIDMGWTFANCPRLIEKPCIPESVGITNHMFWVHPLLKY